MVKLLLSLTGLLMCFPLSADTGDAVVTAESSEVTMNSAILCGYVNPEYLTPGMEFGIILSTSSTPSLANGIRLSSEELDKNNKFFVQAQGLSVSTTYYYKAYIKAGAYRVGEVRQFTTKAFQLVAVDMGLSVKWANANLGASRPDEYGDYYAWGETSTKYLYSWSHYKWCNGTKESLTKYNDNAKYGKVDWKTRLYATDDVAAVKLGGRWRMPTIAEIDELKDTRENASYKWEWKSINGHNGWEVAYLVNGNRIFLPAAGCRSGTSLDYAGSFGYYWSSSLYRDPGGAYSVYFNSDDVHWYFISRYYGFSVRPVSE